ncbi:hypothetical protein HS088_TW09G01409 [Tripterygium wilfordii]|uniref:Uncharacterized protein n=1 Tax=Tripterygium wilfordii TaxID=458696 RepID=A0A7J7DAF6_TRIWF|nr:hypothetical protein HS088_TW09G01409 [Tripterygium wilfordii]
MVIKALNETVYVVLDYLQDAKLSCLNTNCLRGEGHRSTGDIDGLSIIVMASSLCARILDFTSEVAFLNHPSFGHLSLYILSRLLVKKFGTWAAYYSWGTDRCQSITEAVEGGLDEVILARGLEST